MQWYLRCPIEHGYPRFVFMTLMDGAYQPVESRRDTIPAMQNGMAILSYVKYYAYLRVQLEPGAAPPEEPPECVVPLAGREGRQLGGL